MLSVCSDLSFAPARLHAHRSPPSCAARAQAPRISVKASGGCRRSLYIRRGPLSQVVGARNFDVGDASGDLGHRRRPDRGDAAPLGMPSSPRVSDASAGRLEPEPAAEAPPRKMASARALRARARRPPRCPIEGGRGRLSKRTRRPSGRSCGTTVVWRNERGVEMSWTEILILADNAFNLPVSVHPTGSSKSSTSTNEHAVKGMG